MSKEKVDEVGGNEVFEEDEMESSVFVDEEIVENRKDLNPDFDVDKVVDILEGVYDELGAPVVTLIALQDKDPFKVFLATVISLRTKDEVTIEASKRLFEILKNPCAVYKLSLGDIEKAIYPCGFYKRKAVVISSACRRICEEFYGQVPNDLDVLLSFDGLGRKSANLILAEGFGLPAVCVDTHVHRINNRLGYVSTNVADETEMALRRKLPQKHWLKYNTLLVAYGQKVCVPISPFCSECYIKEHCMRIGVDKSR